MKIKNIISTVLLASLLLSLSIWCIFGEKAEFSESERRALASFPELSFETVMSGEFAKKFEEYATDAFPKRDIWRSIKAYTRLYGFMQKDNNKIYFKDGHLSKLEYPANYTMADHAIELFNKINDKYLNETNNAYFAMIPDKNKFLAELKIDYDAYEKYMAEGLGFAESINIGELLSADDFYYTDTHWRQENIIDVADRIATSMGSSISKDYEKVELDIPFCGVYVGQSAMAVKPDKLSYLTNETINSYIVEGANAVYDMTKAESRDPYEMFLSGNQAIVTVKNPANTEGKRLIIFRDSFGSSVAPLLSEGYSETVLIDLRYVSSDYLGSFIDFSGADVLFMYSTLLLNSSLSLK